MRGVIGKRDLIIHPFTVIKGFGIKMYAKTLFAPKGQTFLEMIRENVTEPETSLNIEIMEQLDKLISFELQIACIYSQLADMFWNNKGASQFFHTIASHENDHAEMLRIIKVEMGRQNLWNALEPIDKGLLDSINPLLSEVNAKLKDSKKVTLKKALEFVKQLESIEENVIFETLVLFFSLANSLFFENVCRFIPSFYDHYNYIKSTLPILK